MIKGIIEKLSKAQKNNEGCYGYETYLTFKSAKRDAHSGMDAAVPCAVDRTRGTK